MVNKKIALIVGAGSGLSASLARKFSSQGMQVALAAMLSRGVRDWGSIEEAVLVEEEGEGTCVTSSAGSAGKCVYCYATEAVLRSIVYPIVGGWLLSRSSLLRFLIRGRSQRKCGQGDLAWVDHLVSGHVSR